VRRSEKLPAIPTAATTAAATAISAAAATATTTTSSLHLGTRFVHVQGSAAQLAAIECSDSFFSIVCVRHFDKSKSARATSLPVGHDTDAVHLPVCFEHLTKFFFRRVEVEVPNENILQASFL
jgi:hypothetical protein